MVKEMQLHSKKNTHTFAFVKNLSAVRRNSEGWDLSVITMTPSNLVNKKTAADLTPGNNQ